MNDAFTQWLAVLTGQTAERLLTAAVILAAGIAAVRIMLKLTRKALEKSRLEKAAHSLILSIVRVTLYLLLGLSIASGLGINITGLVALVSVLTLSVSLSLQNLLTNMIGGFTLLNSHPFRSGDYVEIGAFSGTVTEITMSYTRLTTPDNKQVSIPNSQVVASEIVNYTICGTRRVELTVSAAYTAPTEKVMQALLKAGAVEGVLPEPAPLSAVRSYDDNAISYILRLWCATGDYWNVYFAVNKRIKDVFDEEDIEMTYPHLNVHLDK